MELLNKNILIVGMGRSGIAVARFLKKRGAEVTVTDIEEEKTLEPFASEIREMGIRMELGQHKTETFENADLIVLSPGVPHTILPVKQAKEKSVPVWGEIELASRFIKEPIVAVTGTNGKTTTTVLVGEMLKSSGLKVFVGGNIGTPLIDYVDQKERAEIIVVEVSSFQLDTIDTFKPQTAVLLNITEDHLDRYSNFDAYLKAKVRIFKNQQKEDTAIINGSNPLIRSVISKINSKVLFFDSLPKGKKGAKISGENIILNMANGKTDSLDLSSIHLIGKHNLENIAAASLAALSAGGNFKGIQSALNNFGGLPHRIEYVDTVNGARYFDDSKATNIDAVAKALEVFSKPVILIMGGRNKGSNFQILKDSIRHHAKKIIVMGEATEELKSAFQNIAPILVASTMENAVSLAARAAAPGDEVLLSPACSSFDMFSSYAQRGNCFRKAVTQLKVNQP